MEPLIIAACCLGGAVISSLVGWLKSGEPFIARDFFGSVLSGIGAAIIFALAYNYTNSGLTMFDVLAAIAAGMGIDVAVNRVTGAVVTKAKTKLNS